MYRTAEEGWADWSTRFHGPEWELLKLRYWAAWWTRKRCFWCRTKRRLELNHLVYPKHRPVRLSDVRPLCHRCHVVETWLSRRRWVRRLVRRLDPRMGRYRNHGYVTYAVRWLLYSPLWALGLWVYLLVR